MALRKLRCAFTSAFLPVVGSHGCCVHTRLALPRSATKTIARNLTSRYLTFPKRRRGPRPGVATLPVPVARWLETAPSPRAIYNRRCRLFTSQLSGTFRTKQTGTGHPPASQWEAFNLSDSPRHSSRTDRCIFYALPSRPIRCRLIIPSCRIVNPWQKAARCNCSHVCTLQDQIY